MGTEVGTVCMSFHPKLMPIPSHLKNNARVGPQQRFMKFSSTCSFQKFHERKKRKTVASLQYLLVGSTLQHRLGMAIAALVPSSLSSTNSGWTLVLAPPSPVGYSCFFTLKRVGLRVEAGWRVTTGCSG